METNQTQESPRPQTNGNGVSAQSSGGAAPAKQRSGRVPLMILGAIVLVGGGGYGAHAYLTANDEDTDDAQVEGDVVPIGARTGGLVLHVRVQDNQHVQAGDLLMEIDPAENSAKVAQAEAELATAQAQAQAADSDVELVNATARGGLESARAGLVGAHDALRSAGASAAAAEAGLARSRAQAQQTSINLTRTRALRAEGAVAQAVLDDAQAQDDAAQAAVQQQQAQLTMARATQAAANSQIGQAQGHLQQSAPVDVLLSQARARAALQHAKVQSASAALDLARLQLSYTRVIAPADGFVSRLNVHEGQLIQMGQAIAELVPNATYMVANFKETQVGRMRVGDRAEVHVDAFPGRILEGQIASISGGTGARFSLLPPDNASGNFVKVVQRVPVRIHWVNPPHDIALRAGLSADVTVHVSGH